MREGVIIEEGALGDVFLHPREEYTKTLLRNAGIIKGGRRCRRVAYKCLKAAAR